MPNDDAAGKLLSEFGERRSHLSGYIGIWDKVAIGGSIAIWAFVVREVSDVHLQVSQVALASALTSVLLSVWRWQARLIDDGIVRLYAVIHLCEGQLLPNEKLCTVKLPEIIDRAGLARNLSSVDPKSEFQVPNTAFGSRGHAELDIFAVTVMAIMGLGVVSLCIQDGSLSWDRGLWLRYPSFLLLANAVGICWVIGSWLWWKKQKHPWPLAKPQSDGSPTPSGG
jgi:hypothetical protein